MQTNGPIKVFESVTRHALKERYESEPGEKSESEITDGIVEVRAARLFAETGRLAGPGPIHVTRPL